MWFDLEFLLLEIMHTKEPKWPDIYNQTNTHILMVYRRKGHNWWSKIFKMITKLNKRFSSNLLGPQIKPPTTKEYNSLRLISINFYPLQIRIDAKFDHAALVQVVHTRRRFVDFCFLFIFLFVFVVPVFLQESE